MRHDSQYPLRQAHYVSHSTDFANRAFFISATTAVRLKREQIQLVVDGDVVGTGVAARKGLLQGHLLEKSD